MMFMSGASKMATFFNSKSTNELHGPGGTLSSLISGITNTDTNKWTLNTLNSNLGAMETSGQQCALNDITNQLNTYLKQLEEGSSLKDPRPPIFKKDYNEQPVKKQTPKKQPQAVVPQNNENFNVIFSPVQFNTNVHYQSHSLSPGARQKFETNGADD